MKRFELCESVLHRAIGGRWVEESMTCLGPRSVCPQEDLLERPITVSSDLRVAVYICGDERIFFPALVALESIRRHNSNYPFDYFMAFSAKALTPRMRTILSERRIGFIAREDFDGAAGSNALEPMVEGKWPQELFDNWLAPLYFRSIGYRHALKVDYDVLCVAPYRLTDLVSSNETFCSVVFEVDLEKNNVSREVVERLGIKYDSGLAHAPYSNVGFMAIDCESYEDSEFLSSFISTYSDLRSLNPKVPLCEQATLSMLFWSGRASFRAIDPNYNVRIITRPPILSDGSADIRNIHYATHHKPWLRPDFRWFDKYVPIGKTSVYLYRSVWLRAAARDPVWVEYLDFDPNDELQNLGLQLKVLNAYL